MKDLRTDAKRKSRMLQWLDDDYQFWRRVMTRSSRWRQENPTTLFTASALALAVLALAAMALWFGLSGALARDWPWELSEIETTEFSVLRLVLFILAGAVGVIGVVVAYRRQQSAEQGRFLERLAEASRLLGDQNPTIQAAGITALAGLADAEKRARRQQCVDVLCAYIRLPYFPVKERDRREVLENVVRRRTLRTLTGPVEEERSLYRPHDRHTRESIIRAINQHLRVETDVSWSDLYFDFTGAVFDYGNFTNAVFNGEFIFRDARFESGDVSFKGAHFIGGRVDFGGAQFSGSTVTFKDAIVEDCIVNFGWASFTGGIVNFYMTELLGGIFNFAYASFSGSTVYFEHTKFIHSITDFRAPRDWTSPPLMPWRDGDKPPGMVTPRSWPPVVYDPPPNTYWR